ncbi:hypothetical protein JGU72_05475 [Antrihabitans sp. YC2-6]|nr:hypothetical protein [Antrihabitans sp. YC2-6]
MFLRSHRGLGTPIAMQGLWRTSVPFDADALAAVHTALATGPLGRRVVRSRIPGARPRWRVDAEAYPLTYTEAPLPADRLIEWADARAPKLDPTTGPGWRLSATRLDDGGTLVSLVCSHVLADARGLVLATQQALTGRQPVAPEPDTSDWADARRQWGIVGKGTARAIRGLVAHPERRAELQQAAPAARGMLHAQARSAIVLVDAAAWDRVAAERGGSANSLFVALVVGILRSSGWTDDTIEVALPVDTRADDTVGNAMAMAEATVSQADSLTDIRRICRDAYAHPMTSPAGFPEELLQVLPARLAHKLAAGAGERDVLCSNIGTLPPLLADVGGHPTTGIATRAIHPYIAPRHWNLLRTKLSGYLNRTGDRYCLALVSLDPANIASNEQLRELACAELGTWDLIATAW